jgi:arabinogalactan oligomer / maltooligosaccharide transport system permease protein
LPLAAPDSHRDIVQTGHRHIYPPAHPTLNNYKYVLTFNNNVFITWLLNSLKIAVMTTVVGLAFSCPAAYAFSRWSFLGK